MIELVKATIGYQGRGKAREVLKECDMEIREGELLCILGPNGIGKTTLYRSILKFLPLISGRIEIDGRDIHRMGRVELAKKVAYVPQVHDPPFPYTVLDVVMMGRSAYARPLCGPSKEDGRISREKLESLGIGELEGKPYTELSGGERQMVLIARALVQQAPYLLMDEPTSNLDFGNQMRVLKEMKRLANAGYGVCFTSHYPMHALEGKTRITAITEGGNFVTGASQEILTEDLLFQMYGMKTQVLEVRQGTGESRRVILPDFQ